MSEPYNPDYEHGLVLTKEAKEAWIQKAMRLIDVFGSGPEHGGVRRDFIEAHLRSKG